ncbi:MAG: hypothetical protein AAGC65_11535 [Mucilaginibacter sp.]|uniref:hypothetical protein n=1 Tax=Mucilaginibacter sp. TaxID=1882438 RepID=UPI0031A0BB3B
MVKPKKSVDTAFLIFLGLLLSTTVFRHFDGNYVLSINNYLAFIFWMVVIVFKIVKPEKSYYLVPILLVLSVFNIINFTIEVFRFGISIGKSEQFEGFYINFLAVIELIIYSFINKRFIINIFKSSDKEKEDDYNKMMGFYYKKFKAINTEEFNSIFTDIKNYPLEAQAALNKIKNEREI